jgi:hydroxymethylglutaryl-CoA lyase
MKGFGGCPFASDQLTGNIATENLITFMQSQNEDTGVDPNQLEACLQAANQIFSVYH